MLTLKFFRCTSMLRVWLFWDTGWIVQRNLATKHGYLVPHSHPHGPTPPFGLAHATNQVYNNVYRTDRFCRNVGIRFRLPIVFLKFVLN
jgi:hypothetical protein